MTVRWRGDAPAVSQVSTLTPAAMIPGDQFVVKINGKPISYTTTPATVADVCTGLQPLLAASTLAEYTEASWSTDSTTKITATANTAGNPFTPVLSVVPANVAVPVFSAPALASGGSLSSGTPYFWVLSALNSNGETTQSNEITATPSGGNLKVVLAWTAVPGATGYTIYRSTTSATYGATSELIDVGLVVTYTDDGTVSLVTGTPSLSNTAASPATFTLATPTPNSGPNNWDVAANWSLGAVPITGDDVIIDGTSTPILYGLNQSAVTLNSLAITASGSGTYGLPDYNANGGYAEYRGKYLQIGATTCTIGFGAGPGSGRIRLDFGTVQTALSVYLTSGSADVGLPALQIKGTHASNAAFLYGGDVGFACQVGESTTFLTTKVLGDNTTLYGGVNLTFGTLTQQGGTVTLNNTVTTINKTAGTLFVLGAAACTTVSHDGGSLSWQSSGTCTTYTGAGTVDLSGDLRAKTFTTVTLLKGASWNDPFAVGVYTNGFALSHCKLTDVSIDVGYNRTLSVA